MKGYINRGSCDALDTRYCSQISNIVLGSLLVCVNCARQECFSTELYPWLMLHLEMSFYNFHEQTVEMQPRCRVHRNKRP